MQQQDHADSQRATTLYGGKRLSAQRSAIAAAVESLGGAFTAEELHRAVATAQPGIGLATIYRAISAMLESGAVVAVGERNGSALLARCARHDHHHHLVCTGCGSVVSVECPLGAAALATAASAGHLVTRHEITLYGLCATCRQTSEGR